MSGGALARIRNFGNTPSRPRLLRKRPGGKFGAASKPKKLNAEERREVEERLRCEGKLQP